MKRSGPPCEGGPAQGANSVSRSATYPAPAAGATPIISMSSSAIVVPLVPQHRDRSRDAENRDHCRSRGHDHDLDQPWLVDCIVSDTGKPLSVLESAMVGIRDVWP